MNSNSPLEQQIIDIVKSRIEYYRKRMPADELADADLQIFELALDKRLSKLSPAAKIRLIEVLI